MFEKFKKFTRISIEQVVPGHAGLAGYPRGYDHNFHTLQRGLQLVLTHKTNTLTPVISNKIVKEVSLNSEVSRYAVWTVIVGT